MIPLESIAQCSREYQEVDTSNGSSKDIARIEDKDCLHRPQGESFFFIKAGHHKNEVHIHIAITGEQGTSIN
jgi:hypothetical protein